MMFDVEPFQHRKLRSEWRHYRMEYCQYADLWYLVHKINNTVANTKRYKAKGYPTVVGAKKKLQSLHRWY